MSDTARWFGTIGIAGILALVALIGMFLLAYHGKQIPTELSAIAIGANVLFFGQNLTMIGARASQNGQATAMGVQPTHTPPGPGPV